MDLARNNEFSAAKQNTRISIRTKAKQNDYDHLSDLDTKSAKKMFTHWSGLLLMVLIVSQILILHMTYNCQVEGGVLMRVCDTREVKTVTSRVCMLYKRNKNSDVKLDRQGNLRITRQSKADYSPAELASVCCKSGCPAHYFAQIC